MVGRRHPGAPLHHELVFANHVHELNASEDGLRRSKRFETQHRLGDAFDRAMILLDDVVEVFNQPNGDGCFLRRLVGCALVHRHLDWRNSLVLSGVAARQTESISRASKSACF